MTASKGLIGQQSLVAAILLDAESPKGEKCTRDVNSPRDYLTNGIELELVENFTNFGFHAPCPSQRGINQEKYNFCTKLVRNPSKSITGTCL